MASFVEAMKLAKISIQDKTSSKRMREIRAILKAHDVRKGLTPQKATAILVDLGPTFVKLGQIASNHPDVLPQKYCDAFAVLRADVNPLPTEEIKAEVEHELGRPIDEVFQEFDDHPLGSASIAQVHRALLKGSGHPVAVKVQRPCVAETVATDLTLMRHLLALYEFVSPEGKDISFKELLDELERTSTDELDFTVETNNLQAFYKNNAERPHILSPRAYPSCSTTKVLTMDFASGTRSDDLSTLDGQGVNRKAVAELIANNYVEQVITDGFFHADPHAGNILISGEDIEWIDFGMMASLSAIDRSCLRDIMIAIVRSDSNGLKNALLNIAKPTGPVDHGRILTLCDTLISQYASADLASFNTGSLFQDLMTEMGGQGFSFSPSIMMLGRGLVALEGTISNLSNEVSIAKVVSDYMMRSMGPSDAVEKVRKLMSSGFSSFEAAAELPTKAVQTLDMLQRGQTSVNTHVHVDTDSTHNLTILVGISAMTLLASALFVGSCILCTTNMQPQVLEVPLLGLVGFVCGLAIAIGVYTNLRRLLKKKR